MQKIGVMIAAAMAAAWFLWGLAGAGPVPAWVLAVPVLLSGTLIVLALRGPETRNPARVRLATLVVGIASAIEGVAILAAVNVLAAYGASAYFSVSVLAIVGLHFLPLAHYLKNRIQYATAFGMLGIAAGACAIQDGGLRLVVTGFGAACTLWLTGALTLLGRRGAPVPA